MLLLVSLPLDQSLIFWKILLAKQTVYSQQMLQPRPVKQITPQGIWNENEILKVLLSFNLFIIKGGIVPVDL